MWGDYKSTNDEHYLPTWTLRDDVGLFFLLNNSLRLDSTRRIRENLSSFSLENPLDERPMPETPFGLGNDSVTQQQKPLASKSNFNFKTSWRESFRDDQFFMRKIHWDLRYSIINYATSLLASSNGLPL